MEFPNLIHRRNFLRNTLLSTGALWTTPGLFAEALTKTPRQTEGPFYPDKLPLDTDNDLLLINDSLTPAVGEITHFSGTVTTTSGSPVRNAVVEIWQADKSGVYIHSESNNRGEHDKNFQGYGRFLTGSKGEYYFRCIRPSAYQRRVPHIHVAVSVKGKRVLTTQCYDSSYEGNKKDFLLRKVPADLQDLLIADFQPVPGSETGEFAARFDMVIGLTPED